MMTPITRETEWTPVLQDLPAWTPPQTPTFVISPHPDDETLGAGGLICSLTRAGMDVSVVAVTDGENAYDGAGGLGPIREAEQRDALAVLGVHGENIHRLRMPDSGLRPLEHELVRRLLPLVQPGVHLIAPWVHDFHPDHEVCGRAAQTVAQATGSTLTFYFFWTWHRGTPAQVAGIGLRSFALSPEMVRRKNDALMCHRSQLEWPDGRPILPENLLEPMARPYEVYLPV